MSLELERRLKSGIKRLLASRGYALAKMNADPAIGTMEGAFRSILQRKHSFNTVVDVGASDGRWTRSLMRYFPLCQYLLIEAQPVHADALRKFSDENKNIHVVMAAAGESPGHIYFNAEDPYGGQASHTPYASNNIQVPVTSVDREMRSKGLVGPCLLKLDTHGFEVPILKGAAHTLSNTDVIIMECYNFGIAPECLLFFEMCDYMRRIGFRCIGLVDPLHRPCDHALWQMDLVFVKENRPEFVNRSYQ